MKVTNVEVKVDPSNWEADMVIFTVTCSVKEFVETCLIGGADVSGFDKEIERSIALVKQETTGE